MPGLFGLFALRDERPTRATIDALFLEWTRRLSHVGDEIVETFVDRERGFGVGRVGSRALQPVPWDACRLVGQAPVAFVDGFLHEKKERLRARTSEIARDLRGALRTLHGGYSIARFDPRARRLELAVDRRASRPILYAVVRDVVYFAPEAKALLAVPGIDKTPDGAAIGLTFAAGYTFGDRTLFASIRKLRGGQLLTAGGGGVRLEPYWSYALGVDGDGTSDADLQAEMATLLDRAVVRNIDDVDGTVVFLSGGIDSRAIAQTAAAIAARDGKRLRTVTWTTPDAVPGSDQDVAQRVAGALGTEHHLIERSTARYAEEIDEVTYLIDGLTDLPAWHAHELTVMRALVASGATTVLRGDSCFGWEASVHSVEEALQAVNFRRMRDLRHLQRFLRPSFYRRWCDETDAAIDARVAPLAGDHPDNVKDRLYFEDRIQGCMNVAAYPKQVVLDHRAPLLDATLLDFIGRIPVRLRDDRLLFKRAAAAVRPSLWRIPHACDGNLEHWPRLLAEPTPVRAHVEAELLDAASPFWEIADRAALLEAFRAYDPPPTRAPTPSQRAKRAIRAALHVVEPLERALTVRAHRGSIRFDQILLRMIVLKSWYELFVAGDGSRSALAEKRGTRVRLAA